MKDSGKEIKDMVLEYRAGLMVQGMKVIGTIISLTVRASFIIYLVTNTMEIGKTVRQMVMESISILMVQHKKDIG